MRSRCLNPKAPNYARYGGRGISICARWDDFSAFLADMGPRPSLAHSIERKKLDGNYEPDNCVWATATEQARNRSNNRLISAFGETKTIAEWCTLYAVRWEALYRRLARGMAPEAALQLGSRSGQIITPTDKRLAPGHVSSRFYGVHWNASSRKWVARIWDGTQTLYLGIFAEDQDAARAYDSAALRLRGGRARLNFPSEAGALPARKVV